jgi:osmotically-inducible protein OsmY
MAAQHRRTTGSPPTSASRVRAWCWTLTAALTLLLSSNLFATDPPASPDQHDSRDIRIAINARQALARDSEVGRYSMCVTVRQGIATIWGRVPDQKLALRAEQLVRDVPGVLQARTDLTIGPVEPVRDESLRLPGPIALPLIADAPSRRDPRSRGVLAGNPRAAPPSLADAAWMGKPTPFKVSPSESSAPAALLPPRAIQRTDDVRSAVAQLIQTDVRYAEIRCEEQSGIVTLSGKAARMDHVIDLAQQVARIAGVKEVVVENVCIPPR